MVSIAQVFQLISVLLARKRYLLVLGHMRSYSSLLCHILGSHPEIRGYAEHMLSYTTRLDLVRLRYRVHLAHHRQLSGSYVADKILHDNFSLAPRVLNHVDVTPIFLLRQPEAALNSLAAYLFMQTPPSGASRADAKRFAFAFQHYLSRLQTLHDYAVSLQKPGLFLDAEHLIDHTQVVLQFLQDQLGLHGPLQEQYATFKHTGEPNYGDTSPYIHRGYIVREKPAAPPPLQLSADFLDRAHEAYHQCRATLLQHCHALPLSTGVRS